MDIDARILVATNDDLSSSVQRGGFMEDLFHRLNEFKITIPPLRQRGEDILQFANFFLDQANAELKKEIFGFDGKATSILLEYAWPGNIRELKNVVKRGVLLSTTQMITPDELPSEIINKEKPKTAHLPAISSTDLKSIAETQEKTTILNVLAQVHYNKTKAAHLLNIDRKTLYNKMRLYGIEG